MSPRLPWLLLFVIINLIACYLVFSERQLVGDFKNIPLGSVSDLVLSTVLVIGSLIIILGPGFALLSRVKVRRPKFSYGEEQLGSRLGVLLLIAQLLFFVFNWLTGVNVAGSNNVREGGMLSYVWVLFPVDLMFMVYYAFYRESKYFAPNLVIWLVSNFLRGWSGIFVTVLFMEWCRMARAGKISWRRTVLLLIAVVVSYPVISNMKWIIRAGASAGLSFDVVWDATQNMSEADYGALIANGVEHVVGRLQSIAGLVRVIQTSEFLQGRFSAGDFVPFWAEGLHGVVYERLFSGARPSYIGSAYTAYENFGFNYDVGDWNISLSYPSWFFIAPNYAIIYVGYTVLLCVVSIYLFKKIGRSSLAMDMLWYVWLAYLLAPWFATFVAFIYAATVFLLLKMLLSRLPTIRLRLS